MKIQTHAQLLVAGIVLTPLLILFVGVVNNRLQNTVDMSGLPAYEEVLSMLGEDINARDWESVTRIIARSRDIGEIAIVRDDYLILYSTIRTFTAGAFTSRETMLSIFDGDPQTHTYMLASTLLEENRIYIIAQAASPLPDTGWSSFAVFLLIVFIFAIALAVFSVSMSLAITRTITRSVQILENATRRVAEGDLDLNVDVKGSNEITSLTKSLNKMRTALKEEELRRSRFIMGITHDLKTPLALIKGYAEAIEDGITADPASRTAATEIIAEKADQLEDMINDLLDYVRMETGEWRARLENVSLFEFLQRMIKTTGSDVELLQRTLVNDINLPQSISVPMDERLVLRAFENLIHNAVRYTPEGSVIHVAAACRESCAEITVSDNGPGIDSESLPHIFEMFYRGSPSRREQGLGLGLAVVKWVVDYHGWTIAVSSEKGEGTCFTISVPLTQCSA